MMKRKYRKQRDHRRRYDSGKTARINPGVTHTKSPSITRDPIEQFWSGIRIRATGAVYGIPPSVRRDAIREDELRLPSVSLKRLGGLYPISTREQDVEVMFRIYQSIEAPYVNKPKSAEDMLNPEIHPERFFFIRTPENQSVGVFAVHIRRGEIMRLAILPEFRGRGYAKAAVREAEEIIRRQGIRTASMHVKKQNTEMIQHLLNWGYIQQGESDNAYKFVRQIDPEAHLQLISGRPFRTEMVV